MHLSGLVSGRGAEGLDNSKIGEFQSLFWELALRPQNFILYRPCCGFSILTSPRHLDTDLFEDHPGFRAVSRGTSVTINSLSGMIITFIFSHVFSSAKSASIDPFLIIRMTSFRELISNHFS